MRLIKRLLEIIINAVIDLLDIGLRNLQFSDIALGYYKVPNKCNLLNTIIFELKWNTWKYRIAVHSIIKLIRPSFYLSIQYVV